MKLCSFLHAIVMTDGSMFVKKVQLMNIYIYALKGHAKAIPLKFHDTNINITLKIMIFFIITLLYQNFKMNPLLHDVSYQTHVNKCYIQDVPQFCSHFTN